jgi:hypothetical protein
VQIFAGATNTSSAGSFDDGASLNANVIVTYTGLVIRGGSGFDIIENDAKSGIVKVGNGNLDTVVLGESDAKAMLGNGTSDIVAVGHSNLGTNEAAGSATGDKVTFANPAAAELIVDSGAEVGLFFVPTDFGLTKVVNAADGMKIAFNNIITSSTIVDETAAVASSMTLTAAEIAAVNAMGSAGVAYFSFQGNEYFVATNHVETTVSSDDAIVKLVGVTDIHHAVNAAGLVTLHI